MSERCDFLFVELAEGKPVEILRTGEFVDMNGQDVVIGDEDLDQFVANFETGAAEIEIPVDVDHQHAEAVGWVRRIWREGQRLLASVEWNEIGKQLVGDKVYRYISATINLDGKFIRAITLTNWPAVSGLAAVELSEGARTYGRSEGLMDRLRDALDAARNAWVRLSAVRAQQAALADGIPGSVRISEYLQARIHKSFTSIADEMAASGLLTVDERKQLSAAIGAALEVFSTEAGEAGERIIEVPRPELYYYRSAGPGPAEEAEMTDKLTPEERAEMEAQLREELETEAQREAELRKQVRAELRPQIEAELRARMERRQGLVEFAEQVCGGEAGLSASPEDVVKALENLDDEQLVEVKGLLESKVVDFSEHGSQREGAAGTAAVPDEYRPSLRRWVEAGQPLDEYFQLVAPELDPKSLDLSEYVQDE